MMLYPISWSNYWTAITIASIIYYLVICLKYYRHDLVQIFAAYSRRTLTSVESNEASVSLPLTKIDNDEQLGAVWQQATDEVKACLEQLAMSKPRKEEILKSLQQIIRKYPGLKGSDYEPIITQYIQLECYSVCVIHLSSVELKEMWMY